MQFVEFFNLFQISGHIIEKIPCVITQVLESFSQEHVSPKYVAQIRTFITASDVLIFLLQVPTFQSGIGVNTTDYALFK